MKFLDKNIAPMGMGCWAIGGPFFSGEQALSYGQVVDSESIATVHAAHDAGIQLFDTAAVYGAGHGEVILGKALKGRSDVMISTKIGLDFDQQSKQLFGQDINPENVLPAIDACLKRLQREDIDLLLLHVNTLPLEQAAPLFEQMQLALQAGKVRAFGWSTDFPASVEAMASQPGFKAVQHAMNIYNDVPAMNTCIAQHQLTSLIRSPLAMGVLTGKFDGQSALPANDIRSADESWSPPYFVDGKVAPELLVRLEAVRELLKSDGRSLAQGALCWILAKSDRAIPLPGARNVKQIEDNAGALSFGPLPASVMDEIETLIQREPEGEAKEL